MKIQNPMAMVSIATICFTLACGSEKTATNQDAELPPPSVVAMHRLTESQIQNSVADLFGSDSLPDISLPQEIPFGGFSNQAIMRDATPFLVESLQRSLSAVATEAVQQGGSWLTCHPDEGAEAIPCATEVLTNLMPKAWRRPVSEEEIQWISDAFSTWHNEVGFDDAMILSLSVILQSPDFLYLTEIGIPESEVAGARSLTDWEIASRLSYLIWDSMPDDELFAAANNGDLQNAEQLRDQAVRMLRDEKSRMAVIEFFRQWLGASYAAEVDPDYTAMNHIVLSEAEAEYFDYVNAEGSIQELIELDEYWGAIKRDIKLAYEGEFELFVDETVFGSGTLKDLLTSRNGFVSQRTARFYGVSTEGMPSYTYVSTEKELNVFDDYPEIEMFAVPLPANQRAGIFTQGAFLAGHSHPNQPSPVLRGVFLRERLLCLAALAPPGDIPALSTSSDGSWTTNRERFAQHTEDPACASCHVFIDGAGFPFENYDAVGAWRDTDNGETVDASGELLQTDVDGPVANAIEMLEALAESRQVHDCAVLQLYRYATHRPEEDSDAAILTALQQDFWDDGGLLPNLYLRIVLSSAFRSIPSNDGGAQ